jgi:hypothetical protein
MGESHVITALQDKFRRIKGQISALDVQASQLRTALDHIEAVIRMFQADWRAENEAAVVPYKPSRWQRRGEGIKTALEVLRDATKPMTTREIVIEVWERKVLPMPPRQELYQITSTFNMALGRRIGQGVVRIEGRPPRWAIMPPAANSLSSSG